MLTQQGIAYKLGGDKAEHNTVASKAEGEIAMRQTPVGSDKR